MNSQAKLFCASLASAGLGAVSFVTGMEAAFGRGGNWADNLMGLGVFAMAAGGILSIVCTVITAAAMSSGKPMDWWFPLNVLATLGTIWGGLVAINL